MPDKWFEVDGTIDDAGRFIWLSEDLILDTETGKEAKVWSFEACRKRVLGFLETLPGTPQGDEIETDRWILKVGSYLEKWTSEPGKPQESVDAWAATIGVNRIFQVWNEVHG